MNKKILLVETILALFIILGFKIAVQPTKNQIIIENRATIYKNKFIMNCSPDWNILNADSLAKAIQPLTGWGNYQWKIETSSDSAQFYFNQGINMYYAFHIIESMASFKKAATFDEGCAMLYWAQALAYGPNINDFGYAANPDAVKAAKQAKLLSENASPKHRLLIDAMLLRYNLDTTQQRIVLNQQYATAMKNAVTQFGTDADVRTLYADALMVQHPWEYWQHNGKAQPWTGEIMLQLEKVLQNNPQHPGANHYYIHTMEASPVPEKAMESADRLGAMMPDVSHMVHMPSHIYIRTGKYNEGIEVNNNSITGYKKYLQLYPDVVNAAFLYEIHNYHMNAACTMMKPNYSNSLIAATACIQSFDSSLLSLPHPMGNFVQYVYMTDQMMNVRYGKWQKILSAPKVSANYAFAFSLQNWANGMAYANTSQLPSAKNELELLKKTRSHPDLQIRLEPFNKPTEQLLIAEKMLEAVIAQKENKLQLAIQLFEAAVLAEDYLIYTEPRDWLIPTRHYLANALLEARDYLGAEKILKEDLLINPSNYYALAGLKQVYSSDKKYKKSLQQTNLQLDKLFTDSDMPYPALVY